MLFLLVIKGHLLAPMGGCSIDFSRMNKMLRLSKEDHDVTVQPGLGEARRTQTISDGT